MIRGHGGRVPPDVRSRLQLLLESVADAHPSAPLLPGLGPNGIDEAHADLVLLARACRTGARSLLADDVVPTPIALAQRLCRLRQYGVDSVGVTITALIEALCGDGAIEQIVDDGSRVVMLALSESLIGIAQLIAAPTGDAPSTMLAMLVDAARGVERREAPDRPGADDERDQLDDAEREAS